MERNARDFAHFDADIDEGSENSKRDVDLSNMIVHLPVLSAPKETERCVVFLLQLVKVFLYEETVSAAAKLSKLCQKALQCVQHCLYLHMDESGSPNPPEDVALKMVLVLLLLMGKLKKQGKSMAVLFRNSKSLMFSVLLCRIQVVHVACLSVGALFTHGYEAPGRLAPKAFWTRSTPGSV